MEFTVATGIEVDRMCEITEQAKRQLRRLGLDQWQRGYPSRAVWEQDVREGCAYLAMEDGAVLGAFAFKLLPDPSYAVIDGEWHSDGPYASLHRVCVAEESKGKGVAGKMMSFACEKAGLLGLPAVRIDTHPGNAPMRRVLDKADFSLCGTIHLAEGCERGGLRIAYDRVLGS